MDRTIDLTESDSDEFLSFEEFSSFGSQDTDDGSVVFLVEASDIPSADENIDDVVDPDSGD